MPTNTSLQSSLTAFTAGTIAMATSLALAWYNHGVQIQPGFRLLCILLFLAGTGIAAASVVRSLRHR